MSTDEFVAAEEAGVVAAEARSAEKEYEKTQDFDKIASDSVAGMDTSSLSALE